MLKTKTLSDKSSENREDLISTKGDSTSTKADIDIIHQINNVLMNKFKAMSKKIDNLGRKRRILILAIKRG